MNLPNKLTVARMIATPIFMFFMLADFVPHRFLISLILFSAASLTDMIDGKLARKHGLITNFGKFLDPLADKMLTTAAFIGFLACGIGRGMAAMLFVILFREFLVSSLRLITVSSKSGKVVAANIWGKLKTVSQMAAIILGLLTAALGEFLVPASITEVMFFITDLLLWVSTVLCAVSGIIYLVECREFIDSKK